MVGEQSFSIRNRVPLPSVGSFHVNALFHEKGPAVVNRRASFSGRKRTHTASEGLSPISEERGESSPERVMRECVVGCGNLYGAAQLARWCLWLLRRPQIPLDNGPVRLKLPTT